MTKRKIIPWSGAMAQWEVHVVPTYEESSADPQNHMKTDEVTYTYNLSIATAIQKAEIGEGPEGMEQLVWC